jgi:hypothetical protein
MKNRLSDPSKICDRESKGEFHRFGIWSVSATIDTNWSIFPRIAPIDGKTATRKKTVTRLSNTRARDQTCVRSNVICGHNGERSSILSSLAAISQRSRVARADRREAAAARIR